MATLRDIFRQNATLRAEAQLSFGRNGLENALIVARDSEEAELNWAADVAAITLAAFAGFAPARTDSIEVWAWLPGGEFDLVQQYDYERLGPAVPFVPIPFVLNPPVPPNPMAFTPRLPGINNPEHRRRY